MVSATQETLQENKDPWIDILMATYNGARYISEQIDSIQAQTYTQWRLLVSDDGSSDETVDIVRAYAEKDNRIRLLALENERHDAAGNFLALLAASDAPYAMFCDQDDVWKSRKIELELEAMRSLEHEYSTIEPLLVFTDSEVVDENLKLLNHSFTSTMTYNPRNISLSRLMVDNVAQGCSMMLNAALSHLMLQYPMSDTIGLHDYWAMILACSVGHFVYLPTATLSYRQHSNNVVGASNAPLTARGGILHLIRNPSILRGWFKKLSWDEKRFQRRARVVAETLGEVLPPPEKELLDELSVFSAGRLVQKLYVVHKRKLLREQRTLYARMCQFIGMMWA